MSGLFDVFTNFDLNVFHWVETAFNTGNNKILDTIMYIITTLGDAGIIWIVLAVALMIPKKYCNNQKIRAVKSADFNIIALFFRYLPTHVL